MSIHHPVILHGSNPNLSTESRIGLSASYSTPELYNGRSAVVCRSDGPTDHYDFEVIDKPPTATFFLEACLVAILMTRRPKTPSRVEPMPVICECVSAWAEAGCEAKPEGVKATCLWASIFVVPLVATKFVPACAVPLLVAYCTVAWTPSAAARWIAIER